MDYYRPSMGPVERRQFTSRVFLCLLSLSEQPLVSSVLLDSCLTGFTDCAFPLAEKNASRRQGSTLFPCRSHVCEVEIG